MDMKNTASLLPDIANMLKVETRVNDIAHGEATLMLPALREQIGDLSKRIEHGNKVLRTKILAAWIALKEPLEDAQEDDSEENGQELLRARSTAQQAMAQASSAIADVSSHPLPDAAVLRGELRSSISAQQSAISGLEEMVAKQQQRLDDIHQLIDALEKPSVSKAFRGLIPKEQDVDAALALLKDPSLDPAVIKAGIRRVNEGIDELAAARKFADLVKAVGVLDKRLKEQRESLAKTRARLARSQEELAQYDGLDELGTLHGQWLQEAAKLTSGWQPLEQLAINTVERSELLTALRNIHNYLLQVRRQFEGG
ncbi:alpha-xenorhabdolysin family binary toxin subunit B [Pseudomonas plecoglossicida]|uniref:alpha-xenorhabdolysin family binary toxin subunit B n=1 Tax=Pseudomonas plecoglossicida TaxID=70775 RepID=UPI0015E2F0B9|nr:alpha-xenorhabdolysin family binary toxin subunit B [Pseudomonas plecoglossicida]MBA1322436.1 alpha-xenorhabdolysin family binary toxin subunit B [Pseudomonas plecoglossicida]